ncbi:MAG: DUF2157 domain-containing protein [Gemmatimonadaceae bacterium]|nr:DUF2157 domain-containing protein [Chitinophagaceae bacterium]
MEQPLQQPSLFSLKWEIRTMLYAGVLLLTTGLGVLVYKNIDTIGHQAILAFIALLGIGSYYYCLKHKTPFTTEKAESPNMAYDYILLLGSLSMITFIGYLQFQYNVFGNRFGLVTFIPMVILFFTAYYFDHLGILSLAITNLAAWAGIAATPQTLFTQNDFSSGILILTAIVLGILLIIMGIFSRKKNIKAHFDFTYTNFGLHLLFVGCFAAMFEFEPIQLLVFAAIIAIGYYFFLEAKRRKSFYILLMTTLYCYVAISAEVMYLLFNFLRADVGGVYLSFMYYIVSSVLLVIFLIRMNKNLKS